VGFLLTYIHKGVIVTVQYTINEDKMLECLIIGDSIAVGTAMARPECVSLSKGGINSSQWNKQNAGNNITAKTVIISLGANDHKGVKTEAELRKMREAVKGDRVFWIDPGQDRKPIPHDAIVRIAKEYGDTILPRPKNHMSADGVHPTGRGYKVIAEQTR
jgi:lysophospholipase L1-like esterase